jgi:type I restriction-modification system DNA methylase subunit
LRPAASAGGFEHKLVQGLDHTEYSNLILKNPNLVTEATAMDKENAKQLVKEFVEKYNKIVQEDRVNKYNEEMTKIGFIQPLFRALGWDFENSSEVTAEETISKKRVDYGFRINGIPKFFLEAKALKADLSNPQFADQAINYAWHRDCTWAVLTDFENIKVFNAEWKTTDLLQSMFFSFDCNQFLEQFDQLWLLSKESFENGLLDKEAEKWGKKSKKSPVGEQLFSDLTKWRSELSKDISQRNKGIKEEDLDEAVQRIIDRLIFIRNCEDRELEPPTLLSAMREWDSKHKGSLAENIVKVFKHFDDEYNSKLFQHHLCDDLDISNQVLEGIIEELYRTKDRTIKYDFAVLDADVLGNVYEQYLGHILKKTAKRATIEEKHAYRKEQGIYYTPTYIVDYIVRNTLGELLKDKKVDVEKIRVLDPACGSGSFLIKAFDVLNEFYSKKEVDHAQTQLDLDTGLPFKQKEKVLLNNIFGVDLDARAVEIAQLNLLLKIAEKKQRLPLLQKNIKCGNSLINDEKVAGDKSFKWEQEFKQVMDQGGFDVVVGNPPYVRQESISRIKPYLEENYETFMGTADLYTYFIERAIKLLKPGGYFGFIVSGQFMRSNYGRKLRQFLKGKKIEKLIYFGDLPVFGDATTYPCIIIVKNEKPIEKHTIRYLQVDSLGFASLEGYVSKSSYHVEQKKLSDNEWKFVKRDSLSILDKIQNCGTELGQLPNVKIYRGIVTGLNKAFIINEKEREVLLEKDRKSAEIIKPFVTGEDIKRWIVDKSSKKYVIFTRRGIQIENFPAVYEHLANFREDLMPKISKDSKVGRKPGKYKWFEIQDSTEYYDEFEKPKIVFRGLSVNGEFPYVEEPLHVNAPASIISGGSPYLSGILNTKLVWFFIVNKCPLIRGNFRRLYNYQIEKIPIALADKQMEDKIKSKVYIAISLSKRLNEIGDKKTDQRQRIEEEIERTDAKIDELVYKLYGIIESEKKIIEDSLK